MTYDRRKLDDYLAALEAGAAGADAAYGAFLDQLPAQFGSAKLAHEADLILSMLAAAELAYAAAASAEGPVRFEPVEVGEGEEPMFRPVAFAPVGGLEGEWQGVPLQVLAAVLDRSRAPQSADDEEYAASFVYVLFRLKAALGVWRGDGAPSARYRLWLKDMAPVIARHPRTGPKVIECWRRIVGALVEEAETLNAAMERRSAFGVSSMFRTFSPFADRCIASSGGKPDTFVGLYECLMRLAQRAADQADLDWALRVRSCLVRWRTGDTLEAKPPLRLSIMASAYQLRGIVKEIATGHGPSSAIKDYDRAIAIKEALRETLEPLGHWTPNLQTMQAMLHTSRGAARMNTSGEGPSSAIGDFGAAIAILDNLCRIETQTQRLIPMLGMLSQAHMGRGDAQRIANTSAIDLAMEDYDRAIAIQTNLRDVLEPHGLWDPPMRDGLTTAYMNRGAAKHEAASLGPAAALADYANAVAIQEEMRRLLEPVGKWDVPLRHSLSMVYMNRGLAAQHVPEQGPILAMEDYDRALKIQEEMRRVLQPAGRWDPPQREAFAKILVNRSLAKEALGQRSLALEDAVAARDIIVSMIELMGGATCPPAWTHIRSVAEKQIADLEVQ